MKPEDWQTYQAQRTGEVPPRPAAPASPPPQYSASPSPPPKPPKRRGGAMGWPMAILLLGLAMVGGCCYTLSTFVNSVSSSVSTTKASKPSIGVLVMENEIFGSIWATEVLNKFKEDDNIKAVVIRVNSPGGAVAPCQEIYNAVVEVKKPVIVSMGSIAASGGLYVAAAGDYILANPGTITGSIGVIMQSVEVSGAMEKVGLTSLTIKSGEFKDMGSPFRAMRDGEREILQGMVNDVYEQFVGDLIKGYGSRAKISEAEIRRLADGRIYSGAEAHRVGLVDELGGFEDAIRLAAKRAGLPADERPNLVVEDGRKPWWDVMMQSKAEKTLEISLPPALTPGFSLKYIYQPDLTSH